MGRLGYDRVGADAQFDGLAVALGTPRTVWPSTRRHKRAFCAAEVIHQPMEPTARNPRIVAEADVMIATPHERDREIIRSGTWMTVRLTKKAQKRLYLVWPDGTCVVYDHRTGYPSKFIHPWS